MCRHTVVIDLEMKIDAMRHWRNLADPTRKENKKEVLSRYNKTSSNIRYQLSMPDGWVNKALRGPRSRAINKYS